MKVLHIVPAITIGGVWRSLQAATKMEKYGIETIALSIFNLDDEAAVRELRCKVAQAKLSPLCAIEPRAAAALIRTYLRDIRPDLIQSHHLYSDLYAFPAAELEGCHTLRTVHGITQACAHDPFKRRAFKSDWTKEEIDAELSFEPFCRGTTVVSQDLRSRLLSYGITADKIKIIHPGLDLPEVDRLAERNAACRLSFSKRAPVVGFVGRLEIIKNPLFILSVAQALCKIGVEVNFAIVGEGRQERELRRCLCSSTKSDYFRFLPLTTNIYPLFRWFDLLIIPSLHEGLPITLLEAMALNVPVVASRVGGIPEVIQDGMNGYLAEPGDAEDFASKIRNLLSDDTARKHVTTNARATVETRFSMESHLYSWKEVYSASAG